MGRDSITPLLFKTRVVGVFAVAIDSEADKEFRRCLAGQYVIQMFGRGAYWQPILREEREGEAHWEMVAA